MNIIGYVRLSDASREESTSVARQREILTRYCEARGWRLVEVVEDVDVSASKRRLDRPGLTRVREAVREGRADAVLVWRLDRLARSVVDFGTLLDEGVQVVSATEPLDTTSSMGRAMAEVLQVFAGLEARAIGERVRGSVDYLRRASRFAGGPPPYGYRSVPHPSGTGRALEPDPDEAPVVREVADRVLGGETLYSIAQDLNARGIPPRRAREWNVSSLRVLLTGDAILGRVRSRGALLRDEHGLPVVAWEPLVPVRTAERLREALTPRPRSSSTRRRSSRLLSGLLTCQGCLQPLSVRHPKTRSGYRAVYACQSRTRGKTCPSPVTVSAAPIEAEIERLFLALFGDLELAATVTRTPEPEGLAEVEEALRHTAEALTAPGADVPALVERLEALRSRRDALTAEPPVPVTETVSTGLTAAQEWATGDVKARRALLTRALASVLVAPSAGKKWDPARIRPLWTVWTPEESRPE